MASPVSTAIAAAATRTLPADERWLTIQQAATRLGVGRRTLYNWMATGRVVARRTAGGTLRVAESTLWQQEGVK